MISKHSEVKHQSLSSAQCKVAMFQETAGYHVGEISKWAPKITKKLNIRVSQIKFFWSVNERQRKTKHDKIWGLPR